MRKRKPSIYYKTEMVKDVMGAVERPAEPVARTDYAENEAPF